MTDAVDDLPVVAGHVLQQHGPLYCFARGDAVVGFTTLSAAIAGAQRVPMTFALLSSEYISFALQRGLRGSAEDNLFTEGLINADRLWLVDFVRRWQSLAEFEAAKLEESPWQTAS